MATISPTSETASTLTWQVHLRKRQPSHLPILGLGIAFGALCTWAIFRQPLPVLVVVVLLFGSVSEYLFPITYQLDATGVMGHYGGSRSALKWKEVRRVIPLRGGVLLSPLPVASRLDAFRGVHIRFAKRDEVGNRAEVMEWIERYLPENVANSTPEGTA